MIAENEIRIGNYFFNTVHECEIKWSASNWEDISDCSAFAEWYKPIPLTEEWLLRLGFKSNPYQDRYEFGDIDVECDKTKGETMIWVAGCPHIKYVHQLHNYIYALTGQEPTIK